MMANILATAKQQQSQQQHQQEAMSEGVPIFLKKTYHMIDTCDPEIAEWDEDGLTFTVKDPTRFETTIIPQFFKHSKFTSFVRQLNFYSFRKIKYSDSIRIDLETEKRTANYWRFRHDQFRQNRPDLLIEIKRVNGRGSSTATTAFSAASSASVTPKAITSSKTVQVAEKSEVLKLKKRIEEMTKNMDKLTEMVQKVTLQHHQQDEFNPGMKRKKTIPSVECQAMDIPMPDAALSAMDMEELDLTLPPATVFSMDIPSPSPPPLMQPPSRESSDNEFVDQLFTAFHEDDDAADWLNSTSNEDWLASELTGTSSDSRHTSSNRPDPELMKRLSDALELLPREIQEMIVNRLIAAIISTDGFDVAVPSSSTEATTAPTVLVPAVVVPPPLPPQVDPKKVATASKVFPEDQPLPLAAATLAALLHHYSNQIKDGAPKKSLKSLPVIPVHA